MTTAEIVHAAAKRHLYVSGVVDAPLPDGMPTGQQVVLLSPGNRFWPHFSESAEYRDDEPNSLDRWSKAEITNIAQETETQPIFPFEGPPYAPFITLALQSERVWQSPIGMLVHAEDGLFTSFRGGLVMARSLDWDLQPVARPCDTCDAPCLTACPVGALNANGYEVPKCADYLDKDPSQACLSGGCLARRACPVGQDKRAPAQNAFHMAAFRRNLG